MILQPEKVVARIVCAVFLLLIFSPGAGFLLRGANDDELAKAERRAIARWPAWPTRSQDIGEWVKNVESYVDDHFTFRRWLIGVHDRLKYALGVSINRRVIVGKDGWLFSGSYEASDVRGRRSLTTIDRMRWGLYLEEVRDECKKLGIPFVLVIPPDKSTVYPEYLPANLRAVYRKRRLDDLLDHLRERFPDEDVLDLRDLMWAHKVDGLLYFKHDSHWNYFGGSLAADATLERLASRGVPVKPLGSQLSDFVPAPSAFRDLVTSGDYLEVENAPQFRVPRNSRFRLLEESSDFRACFAESWAGPCRLSSSKSESGKGRLLMFRDSFAFFMADSLSSAFAEAHYVWPQPGMVASSSEVVQAIRVCKPTVVIVEVLERLLEFPPPQTGRFQGFACETFRSLPETLFVWSAETRDQLKISPRSALGGSAGDGIQWHQGSDRRVRLRFLGLPLRNHGPKIVHLVIMSPGKAVLELGVHRLTEQVDPGVNEPIPLESGLNELWLALPEVPLDGELRLTSGREVSGDFEVKALSIKASRETQNVTIQVPAPQAIQD
jgi:hypothetical protein